MLPDPQALGSIFADLNVKAMSKVDGCPLCPNVEPAKAWVPIETGYRCSFQCSDCGHAWTQDWKD